MFEFVAFMNDKCHSFKMFRTRFANPHGLDQLNNHSCCEDVLAMAKLAMASPELCKIVKTQTHKGTYKFFK